MPILRLVLLFASGCLPAGSAEPARNSPAAVREEAVAEPATPADLFAALSRDVRPQWRPLFRDSVPHAAGDRFKAALSLGAIDADCYLAVEARDAQQVRNLLNDMAALEMTLSISRQMSSLRQKPVELAEKNDWAAVRLEIAALMARHAELLAEQKDEDLAELERIGCWLRAFHIGAGFASGQKRVPVTPCIWSAAFVTSLQGRAVTVAARHQSPTLRTLGTGLERLAGIWSGVTDAENASVRLAAASTLLDSLMADLINEDPPPVTPPR